MRLRTCIVSCNNWRYLPVDGVTIRCSVLFPVYLLFRPKRHLFWITSASHASVASVSRVGYGFWELRPRPRFEAYRLARRLPRGLTPKRYTGRGLARHHLLRRGGTSDGKHHRDPPHYDPRRGCCGATPGDAPTPGWRCGGPLGEGSATDTPDPHQQRTCSGSKNAVSETKSRLNM